MCRNSVDESSASERKFKTLTLEDVASIPLGTFVKFYIKARRAKDDDVLQLGDHRLLVAHSAGKSYPCNDCSFRDDRRVCWVIPCLRDEREADCDCGYLALVEKGGDDVRE